jgi:hypothetical protein
MIKRTYRFSVSFVAIMLTACGQPRDNAWQDLDYSSVYRRAKMRELDLLYTQPSQLGCLDDDLYSCQ